MSWTERGHYLAQHKRKSSGCIIMFGFKSHQFSSKVNYRFKSLDQQLKRVLIRLALPLDSHSLRGTSTDLCVSVQQRVCVWICLCVYVIWILFLLEVCRAFSCTYICLIWWKTNVTFMCTPLSNSVLALSLSAHVRRHSRTSLCNLNPLKSECRQYIITSRSDAQFVFIKGDLCHSRI